MLLYQMLVYIEHGKTKENSYKSNKFNISAPTSNEKSELLERSYSILEIQDYFKYVIKKMKQYLIIQQ